MTNVQLAALATELTDDPKGLGYAGKGDQECADMLNTAGLSSESLPNKAVEVWKVRDAINIAEFDALSINKAQFFLSIVQNPQDTLDITDTALIGQILSIFTLAASPLSMAALLLLATRPCSRAEALGGDGMTVSYMDVGRARTGDY